MSWDGKKLPDALAEGATTAAQNATEGSKNAAYLQHIQTQIGTNYLRQLYRDTTKVWEATASGQLPISGSQFVLPQSATQSSIAAADIDTGTWVHYARNATDSSKFVATGVTRTGGSGPAFLSDDLTAGGSVSLGAFTLNSPAFDTNPLTLTLNDPTNITSSSVTLSATVAGTIPSGARTQIQNTATPLTGPWTISSTPLTTVGTFSHTFSSLPASTTHTYRAYVYDPDSTTIYAQTPQRTYSTLASSGGDEPPSTLSATLVTQLMSTSRSPSDPHLGARGYNAHQYGATIAVGAALKHNRFNASWNTNYCPVQFGWRDRLARVYIDWLTVGHRFPPPTNHNQAVEWVCRGAWGRIKPSLNNGQKQWVQINNPTGTFAVGLITSGQAVGGTVQGRNGNRVVRLHNDFVVHPWAVVNPRSSLTNNEVDADIFSVAAINPNDEFSESKLDCVVSSWWLRVVPWDSGVALGDITANPILCVASADPYVNRSMTGGGQIGVDCASGLASSPFVTLTTQWQQVSYMTSLDAPDKHSTFQDVGITNAEFLTALPPGYA